MLDSGPAFSRCSITTISAPGLRCRATVSGAGPTRRVCMVFQPGTPQITMADTHCVGGCALLYVGISPKAPPESGGAASRSTRRQRTASHMSGMLYSWLPGTGLNLIPRNATPIGTAVDASMVMAVQMMFVEVAAIAVVP